MVDYNIHYGKKTYQKRNDACFGSLGAERGRWGEERNPCKFIEYLPKNVLKINLQERIDWYQNHKLFGIPVESICKYGDGLRIMVRCDVPADLMMASLSVARVLFGENRREETKAILKYYKDLGDMDLAFAMGEMSNGPTTTWTMFQRRDESIVPDFNMAEYLKWYKDPTCNGTGTERKFSTKKTYDSVKTALTGKPLNSYRYCDTSVNKIQFLEFFRYEQV